MPSEKTFGTRLENARALVGFFTGMPAYSAHVPELEPTAFAQLLSDTEQAHQNYLAAQNQLAILRDKRQKILQGDAQTLGLLPNLRNIRAAVVATFGKDSLQTEKVTELTNKMRSQRIAKNTTTDPLTNETTTTMGVEAAKKAIEAAGTTAAEIDFIVFATLSPDYYFPGCGVLLQRAMGMKQVGALDVRNQCSGFVYALSVADQFIRGGMYKNVLVVSAIT